MAFLIATERVLPGPGCSATLGRIRWAPVQSLWTLAHGALGLWGVVVYASPGALAVFLGLTAVTICAGHSVGMHRLLIHRSFETPKWLEYLLVWLGVLVGMAGPLGMIRAHDMRDWHQRQSLCPPHPAHGAGFWRDAWWQMHCQFRLDHPPRFVIEPQVADDPVYRWMEATWRWHQLPLALVLFGLGGWGWVLWGVSLRIFVSLTGHWLIGHLSHRRGHQGWRVVGLPVQGYNLPRAAWISFGESWHGNHHAFPHSARLGLDPGQIDPGFWLIQGLERAGLAWSILGPHDRPPRRGLSRVSDAEASGQVG